MGEPLNLDLVGTGEIADRCGVEHQTVRAWRKRGLLPEPDGQIGNRVLWHWPNVRDCAPVARNLAIKEQDEADAT